VKEVDSGMKLKNEGMNNGARCVVSHGS